MTVETVEIIIPRIEAAQSRQIHLDDIEGELTWICTRSAQEQIVAMLEAIDDILRAYVPKSWKNVGREKRSLVTEQGYISYRRRVYRDENGKRRKPLDELLGLQPYQRNSVHVEEMGCEMAADSSYRRAADWLSEMVKTPISASSIGRMVHKMGASVEATENTFRSEAAGSIFAKILYAESDGVWIHLQDKHKPGRKRAEVKVGIMYTGKKAIAPKRCACENKAVLTQLGGTTEEWRLKWRELADSTYNLAAAQLLVVGGDGASWVRQSFDYVGGKQAALLDRFHLVRAVHQAFAKVMDTDALLETLTQEGFEAVEAELKAEIKGKPERLKVYQYLKNNADSLVALKYRYPADLPFCTLGAIEGNVDKLVRQRMRGRGMSWSRQGAIAMLAILRHKEDLQNHAFPYAQINKPNKYHHRVSRGQDDYQPYQASIPAFVGPAFADPTVQLLKRKLVEDLSLSTV